MSREIGTIKDSGSRGVDLDLNRYFGGDGIGQCLQLTAIQENGEYGYIQISAADAIAILPEIKSLIDDELSYKRRQALKAIDENRELEKSIVKDMHEVCSMALAQPVLDIAALLTLGGKSIERGDNES